MCLSRGRNSKTVKISFENFLSFAVAKVQTILRKKESETRRRGRKIEREKGSFCFQKTQKFCVKRQVGRRQFNQALFVSFFFFFVFDFCSAKYAINCFEESPFLKLYFEWFRSGFFFFFCMKESNSFDLAYFFLSENCNSEIYKEIFELTSYFIFPTLGLFRLCELSNQTKNLKEKKNLRFTRSVLRIFVFEFT